MTDINKHCASLITHFKEYFQKSKIRIQISYFSWKHTQLTMEFLNIFSRECINGVKWADICKSCKITTTIKTIYAWMNFFLSLQKRRSRINKKFNLIYD